MASAEDRRARQVWSREEQNSEQPLDAHFFPNFQHICDLKNFQYLEKQNSNNLKHFKIFENVKNFEELQKQETTPTPTKAQFITKPTI